MLEIPLIFASPFLTPHFMFSKCVCVCIFIYICAVNVCVCLVHDQKWSCEGAEAHCSGH